MTAKTARMTVHLAIPLLLIFKVSRLPWGHFRFPAVIHLGDVTDWQRFGYRFLELFRDIGAS